MTQYDDNGVPSEQPSVLELLEEKPKNEEKPKRDFSERGFSLPRFNCLTGCGIILVVFACTLFGLAWQAFGYVNELNGEVVSQESGLSAEFAIHQTDLDNRVTGVIEVANIAEIAGEECAQIMSDVARGSVEGRYGEDGLDTSNAYFLSIAESYPDFDNCDITGLWSLVQDYVVDARSEYAGAVTRMQGRIQNYNTWRNEDLIRKLVLDIVFRPPTSNLYVVIGTTRYEGVDALNMMNVVVTGSQTQEALQTGTYDGFGSDRNQSEEARGN